MGKSIQVELIGDASSLQKAFKSAGASASAPYFAQGSKFPADHEYVKQWPLMFAKDDSEPELTAASLRYQADIDAAKANREKVWAEKEAADAAKAAAEKAAADERAAAAPPNLLENWPPTARTW